MLASSCINDFFVYVSNKNHDFGLKTEAVFDIVGETLRTYPTVDASAYIHPTSLRRSKDRCLKSLCGIKRHLATTELLVRQV